MLQQECDWSEFLWGDLMIGREIFLIIGPHYKVGNSKNADR